jgi:hypothetical protein
MKTITILILFLAAAAGSLRADYLSPFADSKVGTTVTAGGRIVAADHTGGGTEYTVHFGTDTGPRILPAEIPAKLIREGIVGHDAKITATIREREDAKTKTKTRFLEVSEIVVSK